MSNIVETTPEKVLTPEEQDVLLVREMRKRIIENYTKVELPKNPNEMQLLLAVLRDVDGSAISRMKIQSDERTAGNNIEATKALMTSILKNIDPTKIGRAAVGDDVIDVTAHAPTLDDSIKTRDFVPGEFDQGTKNLTYDEFMKKNAHLRGMGEGPAAEEETPDT